MPRTWVKLHLKILDSIDMEMLPGETYKRAVQLLCMAGVEDTDGWLPEVSRLAWKFRIPLEQLTREMNDLLEIEFLTHDPETDAWRITNWATYQTNSDPGVNERVRRYREKRKRKSNAIIKEDGNVTGNVTSENGNADVTALDKDKDNILQTREDKDARAREITPPSQPESIPDPVKKPKTKPPTESQILFQALADTTGMDIKLNRGILNRYTADLRAADYAAADITRIYSLGGPWYTHDWRGLKNETPTLKAIAETIGKLKGPLPAQPPARAAPNGKEHPGWTAARKRELEIAEEEKNGYIGGRTPTLEDIFSTVPKLPERKQPRSP